MISDNKKQTLNKMDLLLLLLVFFPLRRSDDSCVLCGGAGGRRDADGCLRGQRGARRVRPGEEGYPLLSAGGDGSAGARILAQLGGTSPRSVTETRHSHHPLMKH